MPRPKKDFSPRPDLNIVMHEYDLERSRRGFIGHKVMPIFNTPKKSAGYFVIPLEYLLKVQSTRRAAQAAYPRGSWKFKGKDYNCQEDGWEEPIDDTEAENYNDYFDVEEVCSQRANDVIARNQEREVADAAGDESNAGSGIYKTVAPWSDYGASDPELDVAHMKRKAVLSTGLELTHLTMSELRFEQALRSKKLRETMQFTTPIQTMPKEAKRKLLAMYLSVDDVWVGNAIVDQAPEESKTDITPIWSEDYVSLLRPSNGGKNLKEPCFGRRFVWTKDTPQLITMDDYYEHQTRSHIIRARQHSDPRVVFKGGLALLKDLGDKELILLPEEEALPAAA